MSLLRVDNLSAWYGDFQALFDIDLAVERGEIVAVIGANGAGKSTLLRRIVGLLPGQSTAIRFDDQPIGNLAVHDIVRRGVAMVPEGRQLFPSLSVEENLLMGGYSARPGVWSLERVYALFPILRERRHSPGTALSGGQQQMVAIGRGLMSNPALLLCDEISLGLAPVVVKQIYASLTEIVASGASIVIVEQDITQALAVADRVYCLQVGQVSLSGRPDELTRDQILSAYLGA